jgi:predicted aspartyl protease
LGHVNVDIVLRGETGTRALSGILVDTGATYTALPPTLLEQVGAYKASSTMDVELADGRRVPASVYYVAIAVDGREAPAIVVAFEGAKEVVGVQTLESLGLKPNPDTGKLEPTRPKGVAYFYLLY